MINAAVIAVIILLVPIVLGMPYIKIIFGGRQVTISCVYDEDGTYDSEYGESCRHDMKMIHRRLENAGIHNIVKYLDE